MTEETIKTLRRFEDLPDTPLKRAIQSAYMVDAITSCEMVNATRELIALVSNQNQKDSSAP